MQALSRAGEVGPQTSPSVRTPAQRNGEANKILAADSPAHGWFRFVLSFPPHLVRDYLSEFGLGSGHRVLDPFCGTGTTLVESRKSGIPSVGLEANPMAHLASRVKVDWRPTPGRLLEEAGDVSKAALADLRSDGLDDEGGPAPRTRRRKLRTLEPEKAALLLRDSISPLPLHRALVLLDAIRAKSDLCRDHLLLALAKTLVFSASNLHFGPEVGVGPARSDAPVIADWLREVRQMASDLRVLRKSRQATSEAVLTDSRDFTEAAKHGPFDAVITSPPYPNEKDYTRTTRLESVILGLIQDKAELRRLKRGLVRSNTRGVYKGDDDDRWVAENPQIQGIARDIESRRLELGKTSGFERMYARVAKLYFGGMARHLAEMRNVLSPGARLAYVVGDQASFLRIMIRTGEILADIACSFGYEHVRTDLFRTRLATATRAQLREEVVILRWPG